MVGRATEELWQQAFQELEHCVVQPLAGARADLDALRYQVAQALDVAAAALGMVEEDEGSGHE